jgi:EAL domain-containing protein (putative c-di-GMP-specific phosphodiesterase class I)
VRIGASIGLAGLPLPNPSGRSVDSGDVLRDADIAMYAAKGAGRNRWRAFDPVMRRAAEDRKSLEDDLHAAVRDRALTLAYQPVVHLPTGRIVGVEALLRWNHPTRGAVPPVQFIPIAEETGLIGPIGAWVLQEACRQAAAWKALLPPDADFGCGVNLSVCQLQEGLLDVVRSALETSGLPADALVLEVTESVFMDDDRADPELLQHLRRLGPKIFLDDFGTGFSSLSYLRRFPVDGLKIDRSFVAPLTEGDDVLASAMLGLADSLRLGVVAEGIELPVQRAALQALGCQLGQGFGMYLPMTADAMTAALRDDLSVPTQRQPTGVGEQIR